MYTLNIAIIGCGPRGLAALEMLVSQLVKLNTLENSHISVFEPSDFPGSGPVWNPEQYHENWMNIDNYALESIKGREVFNAANYRVEGFPSFSEWIKSNENYTTFWNKKLIFYPRFVLGTYLNERYHSLADTLLKQGFLTVIKEKVSKIEYNTSHITVFDNQETPYKFDECLVTIGHQKTTLSKELLHWKHQSEELNVPFILDPYNKDLKKSLSNQTSIAIRGFGLAMIDIMRTVVTSSHGKFSIKEHSIFLNFMTPNKEFTEIIPYSMDGLTPVPKPYTKDIDNYFKPSTKQLDTIKSCFVNLISNPEKVKSVDVIIDLVSELCLDIIFKNKNKFNIENHTKQSIKAISTSWLLDMSLKDDLILDTDMDTLDYLKQTALMSHGLIPFSLDYAIGQIWRHLQPVFYGVFAFSDLSDAIIDDFISLDSKTKRYSFGPPVESILQMIALAEVGLLNLQFVNNPEVTPEKTGWKFQVNNNSKTCSVLVNSVLSLPVLKDIKSEVITSLLDDALLKPVTSKLGIHTLDDSTLVSQTEKNIKRIAFMGRNCKGSIIGADAILECFNKHPKQWALGVVNRNLNK